MGVLPLFCRIHRKKFVHRIASDTIVLSKLPTGTPSFSENLSAILEVKTADTVVAQSKFQKRVLKERFDVESVLIKNGLFIPQVDCEKPDPPVILWVGSLSRIKNPELFIKLAKSLPNVHFEMIGGRGDPPQLYDEIVANAKRETNLTFHGFVPYNKIEKHFRRASVFVNTSSMEGFPNTFIQAWAHYIPVVSLNADPDNVIEDEKIGFCSGTFRQLVSDVTSLLEHENQRKTLGENARNYVEREHDVRITVKKYCTIFEGLF
jgi:glycosyltransferase involved in cell wall biosynthesis